MGLTQLLVEALVAEVIEFDTRQWLGIHGTPRVAMMPAIEALQRER